jgi:N-acetylglucosamine-6-phosphate deacetylase
MYEKSNPKKIQIINGNIILPAAVFSGNLEIEEGRITYIGSGSRMPKPDCQINAIGRYILPGFIDIHTNGIAGFDLTNGVYDLESGKFHNDEATYIKGLEWALYRYAKTGVTRAILTSLAAPLGQLKRIFSYVNQYKSEGAQTPWKDILGGLFVEGTFMKLVSFRGAHNPGYFNKPSIELFDELQKLSGGMIKVVNVVPEWDQSALQLIRYLASQNVICAAGHTGATGRQYELAIQNGLRLAVHFLNGPTGSSSKSLDGGGAVETVLRSDSMFVELIVDGYHVDKAYVLDTIKRKNYDRVIAITDSMFAAELPGLKQFKIFNITGKVAENGEYLQIADREDALFGSKLVMVEAFNNLLNWLTAPTGGIWNVLHEPLDFNQALIKVSSMCSDNPARVLGIYNSQDNTGSIEIGKRADLLIGEIARVGEKYRFNINQVMVNGMTIDEFTGQGITEPAAAQA